MKKAVVPFNKPTLTGNEFNYISKAITYKQISGDGKFTQKCHLLLEKELGVKKVLLTTSCTHALEMCALLLNLEPGDEVIIPSFTFVSTANAFVLFGAKPVFIDIRSDTLNLDETKLEKLITRRTKAIALVHYSGVGCEMESILKIARRHNIAVIEDNAHGLFAKYREKYLGTFGCLATLSFHETKNIMCGEGGALLINDPRYIERAEIIRQKGTNRGKFFRGEVDKYTWVDIGSSYLPSDILAAFLLAQLENRKKIIAKRKSIWEYYYNYLNSWASMHNVQLPCVPPHCEDSCHIFYLILPSLLQRQRLIDYLKSRGIDSPFHYSPLHLSPMGKRCGGRKGGCPVSETVSGRLLRLPLYNSMTEKEQTKVISTIKDFAW